MKPKKNDMSKGMSLKSLEAALRRFPEVEIPKTLEAKLLAQVPQPKAADSYRRRHWGFWSFGGAAAAIIVLAAVFASTYLPNSTSGRYSLLPACPNYARADYNSTNIQDINTSFIDQR
jgi:hypothetical protein